MSLNKKLCTDCSHECHCIGQGFHVSESICDACDCLFCNHEINQTKEKNMNWIKKQWQKFIDWVFKGFYK